MHRGSRRSSSHQPVGSSEQFGHSASVSKPPRNFFPKLACAVVRRQYLHPPTDVDVCCIAMLANMLSASSRCVRLNTLCGKGPCPRALVKNSAQIALRCSSSKACYAAHLLGPPGSHLHIQVHMRPTPTLQIQVSAVADIARSHCRSRCRRPDSIIHSGVCLTVCRAVLNRALAWTDWPPHLSPQNHLNYHHRVSPQRYCGNQCQAQCPSLIPSSSSSPRIAGCVIGVVIPPPPPAGTWSSSSSPSASSTATRHVGTGTESGTYPEGIYLLLVIMPCGGDQNDAPGLC
jgi:hypothetical protein